MHIRAICGSFRRRYGILPYPRHPLKSSHRIHRIHRSFWRRIFSHRIHRSFWRRIFSHGFHGFPQMVRLRYWRRGYGRMPYLLSVRICAICGRHFSARMFCVFSVFCGNSLPVCFVGNVVVFSHGIHGIHGMLGCVIGSVGMAGMPYPPNLCTSVPICGSFLCQKVLCVPRVLWNTLSVCFVGTAEAAAPAW